MPVTNYIGDVVNDSYLMETDETGATTAAYTNEPVQYGRLISQHRGNTTSYYYFDGQCSARQLTDANENVTDTYKYSAFGQTVASSGTTVNPFTYNGEVGYYANPDTGEIYVRARPYGPRRGRWMTIDPLGHSGGDINLYRYIANSPIAIGDPSGLTVYVLGWEGFGANPPANLPAISTKVLTKLYQPIAEGTLAPNLQIFFAAQQVLTIGGFRREAESLVRLAKTPEYFVGCYPCYPRIVLVGYSWGGNTAARVAEEMAKIDPSVAIDAIFTIDPVIGNPFFSGLYTPAPTPNVCRWDNYYQKTDTPPLPISGPGFHGDRIAISTIETEVTRMALS